MMQRAYTSCFTHSRANLFAAASANLLAGLPAQNWCRTWYAGWALLAPEPTAKENSTLSPRCWVQSVFTCWANSFQGNCARAAARQRPHCDTFCHFGCMFSRWANTQPLMHCRVAALRLVSSLSAFGEPLDHWQEIASHGVSSSHRPC